MSARPTCAPARVSLLPRLGRVVCARRRTPARPEAGRALPDASVVLPLHDQLGWVRALPGAQVVPVVRTVAHAEGDYIVTRCLLVHVTGHVELIPTRTTRAG